MKYTNYFSQIITEKDISNLSTDQFKRIMNIVFIEGCLAGAKNAAHLQYLLNTLTNNQEPNNLYFEMKLLSETHYRKQNNNT
ncbi:hypothetical protein [Aequorivita lipolytica]|uniref:Uncharacterized protein n=2 Tax=Aequorivita lipolytica TaxID=153267 RepID=A0A5C6YUB7_9FLAO|nr:hypothetical protein ESV24_00330 [Aequorivita lipolytica]